MQLIKVRLKGSSLGATRNIRCPLPEVRVLDILEGTDGMTGTQISRASGGTISRARANRLIEKLKERDLVKSFARFVDGDDLPVRRVFHIPTFERMDQ